MSLDFTNVACQTHTNKRIFGLCDDPPPAQNPAYINETNGETWIARVINHHQYNVTFTAVDHCVIQEHEQKGRGRCEGFLSYGDSVIFVELKSRGGLGAKWVVKAENQIRSTIQFFEETELAQQFSYKRAYIANSEHPKAKISQMARMEAFEIDTGYVLRIENTIYLEHM
jgi:hypothetical protein